MRDDADAVGHALRDFEDVRGHDHGAAGADTLGEHVFHQPGAPGVEARQRLVEDDEFRIVHQRTGQRHFLAHAARESFAAFVARAA